MNPDLVITELQGEDRKSIYVDMLKKAFYELSLDFNEEEIADEMIKREDLIMIPYENGVALPHLRKQEFEDLYIIVGLLKEPVRLKNNDSADAKVVIMSLISEKTSGTYLKALAAFSRYLMKSDNVEKFVSCKDSDEILELLDADGVILKKDITAEDVMNTTFPYVTKGASISEALDIFSVSSRVRLAVLDEDKKLVGVLDAAEVIQKSIPKHYMMLDNFKILSSFEPFENILSQEKKSKVDDFMRAPRMTIAPDTPLIQLTLSLIRQEAANLYVLDEDGRLLGVVAISEIIQNVLRA
jgi:mannitol/fructose-specific phosphotransferase system IIA component (Ntr-type)